MQQGSIKKEAENRNWQVVVDFGIVATLVAGVVIGVLFSFIWKG